MDQPSQKKLLRPLWAIIAVLVVFLLVLATAIYLVVQPDNKKNSTTSTTVSSSQVATKSDISQNLDDLNSSVKQASKDQSAAKAVIDNSKTQVKVGS